MTRAETEKWRKDLNRLKQARGRARRSVIPAAAELAELGVNPSLELIPTGWRGLAMLTGSTTGHAKQPEPGDELILVWRSPTGAGIRTEPASAADLLALKIVIEGRDPHAVARENGVPVETVDAAIQQAAERGILLAPVSRINRPAAFQTLASADDATSLTARIFTLQWHITQECDLACRHCYDRNQRRATTLDEGLVILDQLHEFCRSRFVRGQVSFSGGNPFLHPDFNALYRAAAERGFTLAILGNPVPRQRLEEILAIRHPVYLQVSLEGLAEHNDLIRGAGHFQRTLDFLALLRELSVSSEVMLTLTRDNLDQVLPLAELLRDQTDAFTFNRLAPFGAGADLALPSREAYAAFLQDYLAAMPRNPVLALKDSLLNTVLERDGRELFGGCAGYGCGAAFNFLALLPDGEVHACRKFPSLIGNVHSCSLAEIYDSPLADRYRAGSSACTGCRLKPVCGGCAAVTAGTGLDPASSRDPFCFRPGQTPSHKSVGC